MKSISVIGMGYVGLLALEFSKYYNVVGLILIKKINRLKNNIDDTGELKKNIIKRNKVFYK